MSSQNRENLTKGPSAEEAVRYFFIETGSFAVRSLKLYHDKAEVTDVDVWVYSKSNNYFRHRQVVDIKNRKSPNALERILWVKGLQDVLSVDAGTVATTNSDPSVRSFAEANDVTLIDGPSLQTIVKVCENKSDRIPEEVLDSLAHSESQFLKGLGRAYLDSKAALLTKLDFSGCNKWIENSRTIMNEYLTPDENGSLGLRVLYTQLAFLLIGLDYCLVNKSFDSDEKRKAFLQDGFFFGEVGKKGVEHYLDSGVMVAQMAMPKASISKAAVKAALNDAARKLNFDILVEHFSKLDVRKDLFQNARAFELAAFSKILKAPNELDIEQKAFVLLLADVFELKREKIMGFTVPKN